MAQIIPSLLVPDETTFLEHLRGLGNAVDMVQIDIADGVFVENKTWADPTSVKHHLQLDCELHLMVAKPLLELKKWGAVEQVKRVLVHYESVKNLHDIMPTLHAYGWEIGLALNPETPADVLDPFLPEIKAVMFMGVAPGRQGNPYVADTPRRIADFKAKNTGHYIEVDGGVNDATLPELIAAGVDAVCPGSAIFGNERSPEENVERMRALVARLTVRR